jgi:hypothetical protein
MQRCKHRTEVGENAAGADRNYKRQTMYIEDTTELQKGEGDEEEREELDYDNVDEDK